MSSVENVSPRSNAISAGNRDKKETLLRRNAVLDSWPLHYSRSPGNGIVSRFFYLFFLLLLLSLLLPPPLFSLFFSVFLDEIAGDSFWTLPTAWISHGQEIVFIIDRYISQIASGKYLRLVRNTTFPDCNRIIIASTTISELHVRFVKSSTCDEWGTTWKKFELLLAKMSQRYSLINYWID